eukprot:TRINITY_DN5849_c0_g1_i2.p1 TRINITY_DN5849_c0_g1~~TRINITY_DN5849_c0_g1_i2.p1  ORF type:complete len:328 (-),score=41.07 TRINITY_DN5849_c0_g1_i2:46-1029(-)
MKSQVILLMVFLPSVIQSIVCQSVDFRNNTIFPPNCTTIHGDFAITDTNLTNLLWFTGIVEVGGKLLIQDNYDLEGLDGLSSLALVSNGVVISNNPLLPNLTGIANCTLLGVTKVGEGVITVLYSNMKVYNNSMLTELGWRNVMGDILEVSGNVKLLDFGGIQHFNESHIDLSVIDMVHWKDLTVPAARIKILKFSNCSVENGGLVVKSGIEKIQVETDLFSENGTINFAHTEGTIVVGNCFNLDQNTIILASGDYDNFVENGSTVDLISYDCINGNPDNVVVNSKYCPKFGRHVLSLAHINACDEEESSSSLVLITIAFNILCFSM